MSARTSDRIAAGEALNRRFAAVQHWGARLTLLAVMAAFALYVTGVLTPRVPLARLPALLGEGVEAFVRSQSVPTGWAWLGELQRGDLLSLATLVAMVGVVVVSYIALLPLLVRRRDWIYLALVLVQLAVFGIAAGLWPGGGR